MPQVKIWGNINFELDSVKYVHIIEKRKQLFSSAKIFKRTSALLLSRKISNYLSWQSEVFGKRKPFAVEFLRDQTI